MIGSITPYDVLKSINKIVFVSKMSLKVNTFRCSVEARTITPRLFLKCTYLNNHLSLQ